MNPIYLRNVPRFGLWAAVVALLLMVCPVQSGWADDSEGPLSDKVQVELMVVHASNSYTTVDPQLARVQQHLKFVNFKGFKLLDRQSAKLSDGQNHAFKVEGNRRVEVELRSHTTSKAELRVQMFGTNRQKALDTTISVHRNKSFMVAGPKYQDGVLILPLTVSY